MLAVPARMLKQLVTEVRSVSCPVRVQMLLLTRKAFVYLMCDIREGKGNGWISTAFHGSVSLCVLFSLYPLIGFPRSTRRTCTLVCAVRNALFTRTTQMTGPILNNARFPKADHAQTCKLNWPKHPLQHPRLSISPSACPLLPR